MPKKKQPLDLAQHWQAARDYHAATITHACLTAAAAVLTGWKLFHIKKELGFLGSGRRQKKVATVATLTWKQWLGQEIPDLPDRTADRRIATYNAAKSKFRGEKQTRLLELLEAKSLSEPEHLELQNLVHKCLDGQAVNDIFRDAGVEKLPQGSSTAGGNLGGGDDGDDGDEEPDPVQLALNLWEEPLVELNRVFESSADTLESLPLRGSEEEAEFGVGKCLTLDALAEELAIRSKEANTILEERRKG